ncbi:MAG: hypothetical protein RMJ88_12175 [Thermogemmata sp.]|nr:hypothetical protein [Thermogemmata sp.]
MPMNGPLAICLSAGMALGLAVVIGRKFVEQGAYPAALAQQNPTASSVPVDRSVETAIAQLQQVGREGQGNAAAAQAWQTLVAAGRAAFFPALRAVREDQPIAANWLRTALDAIVEKEQAAGRTLPLAELEAFVTDRRQAPRARFWAYEWLVQAQPSARDRMLPLCLDDPSLELRRLAIAYELDRLERSGRADSRAELERLFGFARDRDQVDALAQRISQAGGQADVTRHFGFCTHLEWLGPWDAPGSQGYSLAYPPEKEPLAAGPFRGKDQREIQWQTAETTDRYGLFDLNKLVGKHKDAVVFMRAVLRAPQPTPCQIRVTSPTAVKIFLNGEFLFGREEYHHGTNFDAHIAPATLRAGDNIVLIKVCQNNQQESWAQAWQVQVRICDATGGPIPALQQVIRQQNQMRTIPLGARREKDSPLPEK